MPGVEEAPGGPASRRRSAVSFTPFSLPGFHVSPHLFVCVPPQVLGRLVAKVHANEERRAHDRPQAHLEQVVVVVLHRGGQHVEVGPALALVPAGSNGRLHDSGLLQVLLPWAAAVRLLGAVPVARDAVLVDQVANVAGLLQRGAGAGREAVDKVVAGLVHGSAHGANVVRVHVGCKGAVVFDKVDSPGEGRGGNQACGVEGRKKRKWAARAAPARQRDLTRRLPRVLRHAHRTTRRRACRGSQSRPGRPCGPCRRRTSWRSRDRLT